MKRQNSYVLKKNNKYYSIYQHWTKNLLDARQYPFHTAENLLNSVEVFKSAKIVPILMVEVG